MYSCENFGSVENNVLSCRTYVHRHCCLTLFAVKIKRSASFSNLSANFKTWGTLFFNCQSSKIGLRALEEQVDTSKKHKQVVLYDVLKF